MNPYPLSFQPVLKQTIWGGRRLGDRLGKPIGEQSDYAESWEVVDHGTDQSVVDTGPLEGQSLAQVIAGHRNWLLGEHAEQSGDVQQVFPLLLKYLDCNRVLSVQVHPSDDYAVQMTPPDLGKTEAWYIVESESDSLIYAGLKSGVDRAAFASAIDSGETESVLHSFHPEPGDVVYIPAGTVHALGAGLLVAEIQQSSDTTFRLFDWNRLGGDGQPRALHLQQGLDVSDYQSGPVAPRRCEETTVGWQNVVESDKFVLRVMKQGPDRLAGDGQFHIVTVPRGVASLRWSQGVMPMKTGATVLLPASIGECEILAENDSAVLSMHLPQ